MNFCFLLQNPNYGQKNNKSWNLFVKNNFVRDPVIFFLLLFWYDHKILTNTESSECPLFRTRACSQTQKRRKVSPLLQKGNWGGGRERGRHLHFYIGDCLTFLATKSTTTRATIKQPAAILAARRFVAQSMKTSPQIDEPRSNCKA